MSRIIGCRDLHIAKVLADPVGGPAKFDTPKKLPSLINVSITDSVESSKFFSDDTVEQSFSKISGKEVTIELGYLSAEDEALLTGKEYDETTGVIVQKSDDVPQEIALLFRAPKSKGGFKYVVLYKGTLLRDETEYATQEDSIESSTVSLSGTFIPLTSNGMLSAQVDSDIAGSSTITGKWFEKVYVKGQEQA